MPSLLLALAAMAWALNLAEVHSAELLTPSGPEASRLQGLADGGLSLDRGFDGAVPRGEAAEPPEAVRVSRPKAVPSFAPAHRVFDGENLFHLVMGVQIITSLVGLGLGFGGVGGAIALGAGAIAAGCVLASWLLSG